MVIVERIILIRTEAGARFKSSAVLTGHARYAVFQMAEAALPRRVFAGVLALINGLRDPPVATVSV